MKDRACRPGFPRLRSKTARSHTARSCIAALSREANGLGWSTDYPYAGINLMTRLSELTKTPISVDRPGNPNYWVVRLTDDALFHCPFTMATDVGTLEFSEEEVQPPARVPPEGRLPVGRRFLGDARPGSSGRAQIGRVLPEFPIEDVPPDHPILHALYPIAAGSAGHEHQLLAAERRRDLGARDGQPACQPPDDRRRQGRIMVLMTHNTDIGDSWEREGEDHEFFLQFSPNGYALGINAALYSMTH